MHGHVPTKVISPILNNKICIIIRDKYKNINQFGLVLQIKQRCELIFFQVVFCLQKTPVNEATTRLEYSDATILESQDELLGIFFPTWKTRYHEIHRKTKTKHHLKKQKRDSKKPLPLAAATNSFSQC